MYRFMGAAKSINVEHRGYSSSKRNVEKVKEMKAYITFRPPPGYVKRFLVTSFSDAAFNITKSTQHGQTSVINGTL